ncbi:cupin domain-containing protein [Mucilaginibacter dorajii]|uniref:Cupin type-2 domain-containing protein n=1 Tax=Mucilaginibacter dorajii TaxID=692994 RepID=A0ABP7PH18_9SPHI|nr:cupin domain-containing protein [Mucilaginibacter dorajii]MCS3735487.1 quercetin 2,3-dioxygenase [Mucilaginibacter dorajii]
MVATALVTSAKNFNGASSNKKGFVIKKGKNRFEEKTMLINNSPVDIKVSTEDTDGTLSITEYTGFAKGGPPLHIHLYQDEVFYILEGEHLFQLGDKQYHLTAGDSIFIPRNVPHAPAQISDKGKYIFFFTPSGKMEDFFRTLGNLKQNASPEDVKGIFEGHDMKIVGPPLSFK